MSHWKELSNFFIRWTPDIFYWKWLKFKLTWQVTKLMYKYEGKSLSKLKKINSNLQWQSLQICFYLLTYSPTIFMHSSHNFISAPIPAAYISLGWCPSHITTSCWTYSSSANIILHLRWVFRALNTWKSLGAKSKL